LCKNENASLEIQTKILTMLQNQLRGEFSQFLQKLDENGKKAIDYCT
jgi:hypothetical protein